MATIGRLDRGDGVELAWIREKGTSPTVVFLTGFRSDMNGDKATALATDCAAHNQAMLRFDYSGHGASGGQFADGTIGRWAEDALAIIDHASEGPLLLVGSSMGGWIALLVARARPERVVGLVSIAAAPNFTEVLVWQAMSFEQRATLMSHQRVSHAQPVWRSLSRSRAHSSRTDETIWYVTSLLHSIARYDCCTASAILTCPGNSRCGNSRIGSAAAMYG